MRRDEKKLFNLLTEFAKICKARGATYYLIDGELLSRYRRRLYEAEADVCMLYSDYRKIRRAIRKKKNRVIESVNNNVDMPGVYYRYMTPYSLMYVQKYHKVRKKHGIGINIHILLNTGDDAKRLVHIESLMESGIEGMPEKHSVKMERLKKFPILFAIYMNRLLKKSALTDLSDKSKLKLPGVPVMSFPKGFWDGQTELKHGKIMLTTCKDPEQYLKKRYGEDYETKRMPKLTENYQVLSDADLPFRMVVDKMDAYLDEDPGYRAAHERYVEFYNDEYVDLVEQEAEYWSVLFFVGDRIKMWKKYDAQRDRIKELLANGRTDEVFLIMEEYFILVKRYLKKEKILYFDDEFWDICTKLWRDCGYDETIDLLEELKQTTECIPVSNEELRQYFTDKDPYETVRIRQF